MHILATIGIVYLAGALIASFFVKTDEFAYDRENIDRMRFHLGRYIEYLSQRFPRGWETSLNFNSTIAARDYQALLAVDLNQCTRQEQFDGVRRSIIAQRVRLPRA